MTDRSSPHVAFFRPNDARTARAKTILHELGAVPVADPLLKVSFTDARPRPDAEYVIFTSRTGAERIAELEWDPGDATVCAIGEATANALADAGVPPGVVPDEFSSAGLVRELAPHIVGCRIEIARSDHGSVHLIDGLIDAGGYVHETVLYELTMPEGAGHSTQRLVDGELDAVMFTSSKTVEHFLEAADDRGIEPAVRDALGGVVVGAIGPPTCATASDLDISVDVIPDQADFERFARQVHNEVQSARAHESPDR